MKVLFVSSWFPSRVTPLNGDFVERHALAVSRICSTAVLHVTADQNLRGRFLEIFEIQKENLYEVIIYIRKSRNRIHALARMTNLFLYGFSYFIGYILVRREIGRPDVIHANIIIPVSKVAALMHRITRAPFIISEHWTGYLADNPRSLAAGYLKPVSKAFALVPVTDHLRKALVSAGYKVKYFIVPNVVDTAVFKPAPRKSSGVKNILHVSSMKEEHKNISGIIRAIKSLHGIRNDFVFRFVGNATLSQKEMIAEAGLNDCVLFEGEVEHTKIAGFMSQSDMLVLFSNVENLPCVLSEALACGIPVISTRVGGIDEWIDERHGILVERGDEKALCDAMNYMLDHSGKFSRDDLYNYAVRNFSFPVIAQQFLNIYNMALNKIN